MPRQLKLLVAIHVMLSMVSMILAARLPLDIYFLPIEWGCLNVILAQATLIGFAVGMTRPEALRGFLLVLCGAGFLAAAMFLWQLLAALRPHHVAMPADFSALGSFFLRNLLSIALVAGFFWLVRRGGVRLSMVSRDELSPPTRPVQFTLRQLLFVTSAAAFLAAYYGCSQSWRHEGGVYSISFANLLLAGLAHLFLYAHVAFAAAWATLRPPRPRWRILLLLIATVPLGIAISVAHGGMPFGALLWLEAALAWGVVPAVVWIGSLFAVRNCGYRLITEREDALRFGSH